jgi:hypothetical protein
MNRSQGKLTLWMLAVCLMLLAALSPALSTAQASSSSSSAPAKPGAPAASSSATSPAASASSGTAVPATNGGKPSAAEIAAAKASGKVWVNTETRIYHKGGRWYGNTKQGKFMTEAEAKAAGYKGAAKE